MCKRSTYGRKIIELEKRLEKLERIEKRRKGFLIAKIVGIILLIVAIIVGGYILYLKVEETLEPYKNLINASDKVNTGIDNIKDLFKKKN
jgi:predicted PurR-regulated permease PerM